MSNIDDSVKFAWAYLLTYGKVTNGKWSYYGSNWEDVDPKIAYDYKKQIQRTEEILKETLKHGIDWNKTDVPAVQHHEGFNGTFASYQDQCLATIGTLVLNNGKSFLIGSADEDAAHLANTAREMIKGKSKILDLAYKL